MVKIEKEKDAEQSNKSQKGHDFNSEMEMCYRNWEKEFSFFGFETSETSYIEERCGEHLSSARCQIDQFFYIFNADKKQVKLIFVDNTTSARDRTKGKASNSAEIFFFKEVIIKDFIRKHPKFKDYDISFEVGMLYPDVLIGTYKNPEAENMKIILDCANINYETGVRHRISEVYGLDFAARKNELYACIKYFGNHMELDFSATMIKDIWKKIYCGYERKPPIWLNKEAIMTQGERVKFCLQIYPRKYSRARLLKVLHDMGENMKKSSTKQQCINKIIELIENQNP